MDVYYQNICIHPAYPESHPVATIRLLFYNIIHLVEKRGSIMIELAAIATEQRNPHSKNIDQVSTEEMVRIINREDHRAASAVEAIIPDIARAIDLISHHLHEGGRLFYAGSGTSGRLGVLDAAECPPTYSTDPDLVQGLIAGGESAMFRAHEGAEDDENLGKKDLLDKGLTKKDVVVGLSASGRTPYVIGALTCARQCGAAAIAVDCSPHSPLGACADIDLCAVTGPEVITGSTRMKAGTAQKMILNMLSTGTMIRLGKVYGNLMVDVKATNHKLEERARRIVMEAAGCSRDEAIRALAQSKGQAKPAIVMLLLHISYEEAQEKLQTADGFISKVLSAQSAAKGTI